MPIRVTLANKSWLVDDLTLDEAEQIEKEVGESWVNLNPFRSASQCKAILRAFAARINAKTVQSINKMSVTTALDCLDIVDGDSLPASYEEGIPDPKAAVSGTTNGSSGRRRSSTGPPTSPDA